jgi:hypothetical protein
VPVHRIDHPVEQREGVDEDRGADEEGLRLQDPASGAKACSERPLVLGVFGNSDLAGPVSALINAPPPGG